MRDTCLIAEPVSTGAFLPHALRAYGLRPVAAVTERKSSAATRRFVPEHFDAVIELRGDDWPVAVDPKCVLRVIAGSDLGVLAADRLAELGKTPHRNPIALSEARRDKFLMGELVAKNGLAHALQAEFSDLTALADWLLSTGLISVVLKPRRSMASDKVYICRSQSEALDVARYILGAEDILGNSNSSVLVQEFVPGQEYMIDTVSLDGEHVVVAAWEAMKIRKSTPIPDYADSIDSLHPRYSSLVRYCKNVLNALGLKNGPAHTEIIVNRDRGPVLVEVNARFHGALNLLFPTSVFGTNQIVEMAKSVATPEIFGSGCHASLIHKAYGRKIYLRSALRGLIERPLDSSAITALPTVMSVEPRLTSAQRLEVTKSLSTSPGTVFLLSDDRSNLVRDYQAIRKMEDTLFERMIG